MLAAARPQLEPAVFSRLHRAIETLCDGLLAVDTPHPEGVKLQRRYRKHCDKRFLFLERADVPPAGYPLGDASEWALRNTVVHRKVAGGFRSD